MGKPATIGKAKFAALISERFGNTLSKAIIRDAIDVISDDLAEKLAEYGALSISNIGTLEIYEYHGHNSVDINSGELYFLQPHNNVRIIPHDNLIKILEFSKNRFERK